MLVLFDAPSGAPLAVMDSGVLTTVRTAAATAVAAKHLALPYVSTVAFVGCGAQARAHLTALCEIHALERVLAFDADAVAADRFGAHARQRYGLRAETALTMTTSRKSIRRFCRRRPWS